MAVWLDRFDVLVIGPGLGRDPLIMSTVETIFEEARQREIPLVVDADGLWLLNTRPELIIGYEKVSGKTPYPHIYNFIITGRILVFPLYNYLILRAEPRSNIKILST